MKVRGEPTVRPSDSAKPRHGAARVARGLLLFVGVPYLSLCVMLGLIQRKLIYFPIKADHIAVAEAGLPDGALHEIVTTADDGIELHGWHFVADASQAAASGPVDFRDRPVVLYFSGNAAHRRWRVEECSVLTANGADVLLFDYRGYGDNAGRPSEEAIAADARTVWNYAVEERRIAPGQIVLYGESLGGGVAVRLAAEMSAAGTPPGGLIARSTFSSLPDVAAHHYGWLPVRWLLLERYPSEERIGAITCPMLMLHGDADRIVPIEFGRKLFAAAPPTSAGGAENRFVELPGADHNGVMTTHHAPMREAVREFLNDAGLLEQSAKISGN